MKRAARPLEDLSFKPIGLAIAAVVAGVAPGAPGIAAQSQLHAPRSSEARAATNAAAPAAYAQLQGDLFDL